MRNFSASVLALMQEDHIAGFTLVSVDLKLNGVLTTIRHTTAPRNITVATLGTFLADNGLTSVEPPKLTKTVDRETYKLSYTDPEFFFRPYFEAGSIGCKIVVYAGFFNTLEVSIGGVAPGMPLTDPADIVIAYQGVIDSHGYTVSDNDVSVIIEGSSPMAALGMLKPFQTTKSTIRELGLTTDNSFDQVYQGSSAIEMLWGHL